MEHITLMSDPTVAAIPVEECGEPLVDLVNLGGGSGLRVDDRKRDPHGAYAHLRAGVLDRLHQAERRLPAGFRLLIVEGYRPPALQRSYFDAYLANSAPSTATGTPHSSARPPPATSPLRRSRPTAPEPPSTSP